MAMGTYEMSNCNTAATVVSGRERKKPQKRLVEEIGCWYDAIVRYNAPGSRHRGDDGPGDGGGAAFREERPTLPPGLSPFLVSLGSAGGGCPADRIHRKMHAAVGGACRRRRRRSGRGRERWRGRGGWRSGIRPTAFLAVVVVIAVVVAVGVVIVVGVVVMRNFWLPKTFLL